MSEQKQTREPIEGLIELIIDDVVYNTKVNEMYRRRKPYIPDNPFQLKSFMPGNIPDVLVNEGDEVKEGDCLLILEAMKMKNLIKAPFDGVVRSINVKVGDVVPKNHVLIELKND